MHTTQLPLDDTMDPGFFALMAKALMPPWTGPEPLTHPDAAAFRVAAPRPGILDRLDTWCWRMEQRAVEAHLSKAQDVYELEARIRDLERGGRYPYY